MRGIQNVLQVDMLDWKTLPNLYIELGFQLRLGLVIWSDPIWFQCSWQGLSNVFA